jgi:quinone-modifying oxidoreductase subunit QmoC
MNITRTVSPPTRIKYQAEIDEEFGRWITGVAGGEKLKHCIQCGQCSALCPLASYMDYTPRQVMYLAREGFKKEALESNSIWLCASCYGCTVECPKQIKITDIMYQLKQRAIQERAYPRRFPMPVLARAFTDTVRSRGRITESWLVVKVFLATNLLRLFGMTRLGLALLRTGRFSLKRETIEHRADLRALLDAAGAGTGVREEAIRP